MLFCGGLVVVRSKNILKNAVYRLFVVAKCSYVETVRNSASSVMVTLI